VDLPPLARRRCLQLVARCHMACVRRCCH
jgi:hypothetical protein